MTILTKFRLLLGLNRVYESAVDAAEKENRMTPTKSIFASKTLYLNLLGGLVAFAQANGLFALVPEPYLGVALAVANVINRFNTAGPVSVTGK